MSVDFEAAQNSSRDDNKHFDTVPLAFVGEELTVTDNIVVAALFLRSGGNYLKLFRLYFVYGS